ncbi:MAG: recombinase family protein [Chloroflexi bacterium]|nr:recombinase family protein [Chloroflexota bacterium]
MLVGYARVSTRDQNLDFQKDALVRAGCEKIVEERQSGSVTARPGLDRLFDILRPGDTLVVWRLDRLGRGLKHLIEIINDIEKRGIGFKSLMEAIDTTTTGGKLVFHIFGALAEFERNVIRERTKAGLASARARGRQGGRPKALDGKKQEALISLYREKKHTVREICKILGISRGTFYTYLNDATTSSRRKIDEIK